MKTALISALFLWNSVEGFQNSILPKSLLSGLKIQPFQNAIFRSTSTSLKSLDSDDNEEGKDISNLKDNLIQSEFSAIVEKEKDFEKAMDFLRRNKGSIDLGSEDFGLASQLITLMSEKVINTASDEIEILEDAQSVELYNELKNQGLLRGFGCVTAESYPVSEQTVAFNDMEKIIDMPISALTPSGTYDNYWLTLGAGLCAIEFAVGSYLNIDPLNTIIPATAGIIIFDRIFLGGATFDQILRKVVPGFEDKIIKHEAGHFLLAYLLGCPIQGCILNPLQLRNFVNAGQGGTLFTDQTFVAEVTKGALSRRTIDRFAIILMAGIAAEALEYGSADGGQGDEQQLIQILTTISPPWNLPRIKEEARWAAAQAVLLITEHKEGYNALVQKIKENAPLGECIKSIEESLPVVLPTEKRMAAQLALKMQKEAELAELEASLNKGDVEKIRSLKQDVAKLAANLQQKIEQPETAEETLDGGVWLNDLKAVKSAQTLPPEPMVKVSPDSYEIQIQKLEEEQKQNSQKLLEIQARLEEIEREEKSLKKRPAETKSNESTDI